MIRKIAVAVAAALGSCVLFACGGGGTANSGATGGAPASPPAAAAPVYAAADDVVATKAGLVGAASDSTAQVRVFKAIPFAAPPVGSLRWQAPQPVASWTGTRRSDGFSAACMQGNRPFGRPGSILFQATESQSEDCLYLNVWSGAAPGADEKRPVMVLLYGGGYLLGSGSLPNYSGNGLAKKGAVVVTLNYRLGPLGFLAHPSLTAESGKASGNYALLDAVAVLQWIRANIAAFGGDPGNVTLYSESAGAGMASVLLASPRATGLFHRIMMSSLGALPAGANGTTLAQAESAGAAFARGLGAATLADLRAKSAADVMAGTGSVNGPIVDGDVLPDQLDLLLARKQFNDVPMLVGWNADEGTPYPAFATTLASYDSTAQARFGSLASAFKSTYPATTDAEVLAMAYQPMRDSLFAWQPWTLARAHAKQGTTKTWLYFFTRRPNYFADQHFNEQDPPSRYGAYHSLEQVYFYNNLDRSAPARPYDQVDQRVAEQASSYLVNFARSGDPNGDGLPVWPAFAGPGSSSMEIGDSTGAVAVPFRAGLDFYDTFYAQGLGRPLPF